MPRPIDYVTELRHELSPHGARSMTVEDQVLLGRSVTVAKRRDVKAKRSAGVTDELSYACLNVLHIYRIRCDEETFAALERGCIRFFRLSFFPPLLRAPSCCSCCAVESKQHKRDGRTTWQPPVYDPLDPVELVNEAENLNDPSFSPLLFLLNRSS